MPVRTFGTRRSPKWRRMFLKSRMWRWSQFPRTQFKPLQPLTSSVLHCKYLSVSTLKITWCILVFPVIIVIKVIRICSDRQNSLGEWSKYIFQIKSDKEPYCQRK